MADTVSLPGSQSGVTFASAVVASAVQSAIAAADGGNSSNVQYTSGGSTPATKGAGIAVDTGPSQTAGHGVIGIIDGDSTADTISSNSTTQFLVGNNAGDAFNVGTDASVSGGSGNDTVNVNNDAYVTTYLGGGNNVVNLADGSGVDLENSGVASSDTVNGAGGNLNVYVGGTGYHTTIDFTGSAPGEMDTVDGVGGQTINLSSGSNTVEIGAETDGPLTHVDTVNATGSSSTLDIDPGAEVVATGSFGAVNSNDTVSFLTGLAVTTAGAATIVGGGSSGVAFYGASAGDTVVAGSGATTLYGGSGTEFFTAGSGNMTINPGSGAETFDFGSVGGGNVVINAFNSASDTIDLSNSVSVVSSTSTGFAATGPHQEVTTLTLSDGTKVTVNGIFSNSNITHS